MKPTKNIKTESDFVQVLHEKSNKNDDQINDILNTDYKHLHISSSGGERGESRVRYSDTIKNILGEIKNENDNFGISCKCGNFDIDIDTTNLSYYCPVCDDSFLIL